MTEPTELTGPGAAGGAPIRLLLVDDHLSFRQPLAVMLGLEPGLAVVAQAGSLAEARPLLAGVDVALVDLDLPDGDGADLIRELRRANPRARALALAAGADPAEAARAVAAGAAGVLDKARPVAELVAALRRLGAGERLMAPAEEIALLRLAGQRRARDRAAQAAIGRLTGREGEVLRALADGLSDRAIGERLRVRPETVRSHMVHLLGKLGVDSRLQALVFGLRHGLVEVGAEAA
jgi:DNA-binding NarL/FixJ family response regulator